MRRRPAGLPPVRCHAKAKSTGEQCTQFAVVGCKVCWHHGGARAEVSENGKKQMLDAEIMEVFPRKSRGEALSDARHVSLIWMTDAHNRAAGALLDGGRPDPDDVESALQGAKTVGRIGQLEAQMGLDDQLTQNLVLQGELVSRALSAGLDWLAAALDQETGVRVRLGVLQRAHDTLVALEAADSLDENVDLPAAEPPTFRLALVEQVPREIEAAPEPAPSLADLSDDELENEVLRRLKERGVA